MVVLAACSAVLSRGQATMFQQTNYYSNPDWYANTLLLTHSSFD